MVDLSEFKQSLKEKKEFEVFFVINEFEKLLIQIEQILENEKLKVDTYHKNMIQDLEKLVPLAVIETKRFGVDDLVIKDNGEVEPSEKYRLWYRFWARWLHSFSWDGWGEFENAYNRKQDVGKWLPEKSWIEDENSNAS